MPPPPPPPAPDALERAWAALLCLEPPRRRDPAHEDEDADGPASGKDARHG